MESIEKLSDQSLGLKRVKSDGTLSYLTDYALKGMEKYVSYPGYQVAFNFYHNSCTRSCKNMYSWW